MGDDPEAQVSVNKRRLSHDPQQDGIQFWEEASNVLMTKRWKENGCHRFGVSTLKWRKVGVLMRGFVVGPRDVRRRVAKLELRLEFVDLSH